MNEAALLLKSGIQFLYWKLNTNLNQSFGLSVCFFLELGDPIATGEHGAASISTYHLIFPLFSPLPLRLALLRGHSLLWLCFRCCCRGRGGSGGRGGGRGWTPSGLYACTCHLQLSSFCKGSVVDTFQKETLSLTTVESLMREENDQRKEKSKMKHIKHMHFTSILRALRNLVYNAITL